MVNYSYGDDLLVVDSDFEIKGLPRTTSTLPNVRIHQKNDLPLPELESTNVYRAGLQANYLLENDIHYLEWPGLASFIIYPDLTIHYFPEADQELLSLVLINEILGICLFSLGYTLLHAGAVEINGKAHIFTGEPGAGKSTLLAALCKYGAKVISDDLSIISMVGNQVTCHKGLPESKLWKKSIEGLDLKNDKAKAMFESHEKYYYDLPKSTKDSTPLKQITFLSTEKVNPTMGMIKYFPLPHQALTGQRLKTHFEASSLITKNISSLSLEPFETFHHLEKWAQTYIKSNAE